MSNPNKDTLKSLSQRIISWHITLRIQLLDINFIACNFLSIFYNMGFFFTVDAVSNYLILSIEIYVQFMNISFE